MLTPVEVDRAVLWNRMHIAFSVECTRHGNHALAMAYAMKVAGIPPPMDLVQDYEEAVAFAQNRPAVDVQKSWDALAMDKTCIGHPIFERGHSAYVDPELSKIAAHLSPQPTTIEPRAGE